MVIKLIQAPVVPSLFAAVPPPHQSGKQAAIKADHRPDVKLHLTPPLPQK